VIYPLACLLGTHQVVASEVTDKGVSLTLESAKGGAATTFDADVVLVSTGRRPFTKNIGCEELGIKMDKLGRVEVDEHFRTAVPSVYAIGDCIAGPMLAHKAEEEVKLLYLLYIYTLHIAALLY
jgi:dihydrolipoamide dehydrogenase